ncbi:MAG TPA: vWA domain-containing protein [Polyangiaceae bacterium]|nr:vWA domain-containing protein [Polyangiaceae bacterium]
MPNGILRNRCWMLLPLVLAGCQTQTDDEGSDGKGKGNTSSGANSSTISIQPSYPANSAGGESSSGNAVGFALTSDGRCQLNVADQACSFEAFETENVPLDIFVMFDRSGSMCSCVDPPMNGNPCPDPTCKKTRLQAIREAMSAFMVDNGSNGLGIGLGYFGQQPIGAADCRPETYAVPSVTISGLPENSTSMMASLNTADPIGETPTGGAIRGACTYARQWKSAHAEREVVILFVTDGEPKAPVTCPNGEGACCPTLVDANQAAAECLSGSIRIKTYVLGVGPFLQNLDQIANAGGTSRAYLVEGGDVAQEVLNALNEIRGNATIPCDFALPTSDPGRQVDLGKINIAYANSDCNGRVFYHVESANACTGQGGWYYDNPNQPSRVQLCPSSCNEVSGPSGKLAFYIGCNTLQTPLL